MIGFIKGTLVEALPNRVCVEAHGVGYEIFVPLSTFEKLPPLTQSVTLLTHLQVKEDSHTLYGFLTREEKDLFLLLCSNVTGVGAKTALSVLSSSPTQQLREAIAQGDSALLSRFKGVGKKTAERIVLELKEKVGFATVAQHDSSTPQGKKLNDAVLALLALGYKQPEAVKLLQQLPAEVKEVEDMVREVLRRNVQS